MFLDESGDHNLKKISTNYPVFVLGGVIVDRAYAREVIDPKLRAFKQRFFGREDLILHTVDMSRGNGDYSILEHAPTRAQFYAELNTLLAELEYKVIACVIRKDKHVAQYGVNAADPYMYSLDILVERFCMELGSTFDAGFICAEKRNPNLDRDLMLAWEELRTSGIGTGFATSNAINARIVGFELRDKKPTSPACSSRIW